MQTKKGQGLQDVPPQAAVGLACAVALALLKLNRHPYFMQTT
jgi:hypothetical protein